MEGNNVHTHALYRDARFQSGSLWNSENYRLDHAIPLLPLPIQEVGGGGERRKLGQSLREDREMYMVVSGVILCVMYTYSGCFKELKA